MGRRPRRSARLPARVRARQLSGTADDLVDLYDDVNPEHDHIRGADDAPVTLVEYGDYQCPYCGQAEVVIRELLDSFGDELRYVWRHLPLDDVHPNAQRAAEAAEAAAAQGAVLGDARHAARPTRTSCRRATCAATRGSVGLDVDRFGEDLRTREHAERVADDVRSADASGVTGTPTFFVNGQRHQGAYDVADAHPGRPGGALAGRRRRARGDDLSRRGVGPRRQARASSSAPR